MPGEGRRRMMWISWLVGWLILGGAGEGEDCFGITLGITWVLLWYYFGITLVLLWYYLGNYVAVCCGYGWRFFCVVPRWVSEYYDSGFRIGITSDRMGRSSIYLVGGY